MGVISVRRDQVNEWVLPTPFLTFGEALVVLDGSPSAVQVGGSAEAVVAVSAVSAVTVTNLALAVAEPDGDVFSFPALVGDAAANIGGVSPTDEAATAAIAYADIREFDEVIVAGQCVAGVVVVAACDVVVPQSGSAEVRMEYYGDGDTPVLPFNLPFLFMEVDFSNLDAAALVEVESTVNDLAVAISGGAEVGFDGDVELVIGVVVGPPETVGEAAVGIVASSVSEVVAVGDADVSVSAVSPTFYTSVLPTRLPFVFLQ